MTPSDDVPTVASDDEAPTPIVLSEQQAPRDAAHWAQHGTGLKVSNVPPGAVNLNVNGRSVVGPLQGFGKMWQKIYAVRISGGNVTPGEVIAEWKRNFASFWPSDAHFYGPLTGIAPGEVALLNLAVGGMPLSTGVMVLYADDESFTLMTPQGHMFAGWITFSAYEEDGATVAQAQVLMRANDPIYELGLQFGGHRKEDVFWQHTLRSLAAHFGVTGAAVRTNVECVDPKRQWAHANNIWHNAAVRTAFALPLRIFGGGRRS
ncbi:MAG: hypothetical protein ACXWP6_18240 [Ktedonobacterales bacterium]